MLALAGISWSFDRASEHLAEFCHVEVSDDTIERVCQEEGDRARKWMGESSEPVEAFARAGGRAEFSSDGVKVNTVGGWREMRMRQASAGRRAAARAWADERLMVALEDNGPALIRRVESEASREAEGSTRRAALEGLLTYLRPHQDRMW